MCFGKKLLWLEQKKSVALVLNASYFENCNQRYYLEWYKCDDDEEIFKHIKMTAFCNTEFTSNNPHQCENFQRQSNNPKWKQSFTHSKVILYIAVLRDADTGSLVASSDALAIYRPKQPREKNGHAIEVGKDYTADPKEIAQRTEAQQKREMIIEADILKKQELISKKFLDLHAVDNGIRIELLNWERSCSIRKDRNRAVYDALKKQRVQDIAMWLLLLFAWEKIPFGAWVWVYDFGDECPRVSQYLILWLNPVCRVPMANLTRPEYPQPFKTMSPFGSGPHYVLVVVYGIVAALMNGTLELVYSDSLYRYMMISRNQTFIDYYFHDVNFQMEMARYSTENVTLLKEFLEYIEELNRLDDYFERLDGLLSSVLHRAWQPGWRLVATILVALGATPHSFDEFELSCLMGNPQVLRWLQEHDVEFGPHLVCPLFLRNAEQIMAC